MRANSLCVFCPPIHIFCLLIFHISIFHNPCVSVESHFFVTIANGKKMLFSEGSFIGPKMRVQAFPLPFTYKIVAF